VTDNIISYMIDLESKKQDSLGDFNKLVTSPVEYHYLLLALPSMYMDFLELIFLLHAHSLYALRTELSNNIHLVIVSY